MMMSSSNSGLPTRLTLLCATVVLLVLLVPSTDAAVKKGVNAVSVSPDWAHARGGDRIEVFGCGFRTYQSVVCMWNWRWASATAAIISDEVVVCETPAIPKGEFDTLPLAARLDLVFDGDRQGDDKTLQVTTDFRFGPTLISFSPPAGFVGGGDLFEVSGQGFEDFNTAQVLFDDKPCVPSPNFPFFDGTGKIRCLTPPGEFNQDAVITIIFDNNPVWTVHARSTYHYGPVLTGVRPSCTPVNGGTRVTIYGDRLLDPMIVEEAPPNDAPTVTLVVDHTRYFGEHVLRNPDGTIEFTTPVLPNTVAWGAVPEIYVFFKRVHSKVQVAPSSLRYGAFVYTTNNPVPSFAHSGGHDSITIRGCGFFNLTQLEVGVFVDNVEVCDRGLGRGHNTTDTLKIIADGENTEDDHIVCRTLPRGCNQAGTNVRSLDVRFTPARFSPQIFTSPILPFEIGPSPQSVEPSRGPRLGGNTVAIRGRGFYKTGNSTAANPGWQALVRFVSTNFNNTVTVAPAFGRIVSDSLITVAAPIGRFGLDTHAEVDFGTGTAAVFAVDSFCNAVPRTARHAYHYGPQCTSIEPAVGLLSGGDLVTIHGLGFTEDNIEREDIEVRFCLDRLNSSTCASWERHDRDTSFVVEEDRIVVRVPHIRQNVKTQVGGNRLFGDNALLTIHVEHPGGGFFPITALSPDLNGDAKFSCPTKYRFGPMVNSITPREGTNGPRAPLSPGLPITVSGMAFADPWYQNNFTVSLGNLEQYRLDTDPSNTDTELHQRTIWGATANTDVPVTVTFNPCNTTISLETVTFGPTITGVTGPNGTPLQANGDLWGLKPWGAEEITISGVGFDEFLKFGVYYARCIIGDEVVVSDYNSFTQTVTCTTRATYFGREAMVGIEFGTRCDDLTKPIDHRNVAYAQQRVFFRPRIDDITPRDGPASGGAFVTLRGEGFAGWLKYECFFGGYTDGTLNLNTAPVTNAQVICRTPTHRAEFNTDVTVSLQLAADLFFFQNGTFLNVNTTSGNFTSFNATGSPIIVSTTNLTTAASPLNIPGEGHHMRAISPFQYHYGAVCTNILPVACSTAGCNDFTIFGRHFRDCIRSDGPTVPINDCVWHRYQLELVGTNGAITVLQADTNNTFLFSNTNTQLTARAPRTPEGCGFRPHVQLRALDALVSDPARSVVQCHVDSRNFDFNYGPLVETVDSPFRDVTTNTSYGWGGDLVTIAGRNFLDVGTFVGGGTIGGNIRCRFGDQQTIPGNSNGQVIFCPAPQGPLGTVVDVSVEYVEGPNPCTGSRALQAGKFHFGPVIRDIAPGYGYVQGNTEITIFGIGFGCCGIQSVQCLFPDGPAPAQVFSNTEVRCRVPLNNISGRRINNVGLRFVAAFGTRDVTIAENGHALSHFYGPVVTTITPSFVDLSGRDQIVTIHGEGFADPFFPQTYCDYISTNGQPDIISDDRIELKFITDKEIRCQVPTFRRNCGAIDRVRPRFRNLDVTVNPRFLTLRVPPANLTVDAAPSFSQPDDGADAFASPNLHWGPIIKSLSRTHAPLGGNAEFVVRASNLRDFYSATPTNDFGRGEVLCAIGNRRSLASVQMVPAIVDQNGLNDTVIRCQSPPGPMGYQGKFALIINPNEDAKTKLVSATDNWHWLPHATTLSRRWGDASGREQVVVYGGGFCRYSTVQCFFGDAEGLHGEIQNDFSVMCGTPPRFPSGNAVTLRFGRDACVGAPTKRMVPPRDVVVASQGFSLVGATGLSPGQGPVCGETPLTITGFGFSFFEQAFCLFSRRTRTQVETVATIRNDGVITCDSADVNQEDEEDGIFCQQVSLRLVRRNGEDRFVDVPRSFEYGHPEVFEIHPSSADIDDLPITVTVRGAYFNGGNLGEDFKCRFGRFETDAVLVPGDQDDDENDLDSQIVCNTPTSSGFVIGEYPLEIVYPCGVASNRKIVRTNNRIPFTVTQRPNVLAYSPRVGPEIGGTEITILGDDFNGGNLYLCSFTNVQTGENIIVSARFQAGTARPANTVPSLPSVEDDDDNDDNGNRRKRSINALESVEAVEGLEDAIFCKSPFNSVSENTRVNLAISIDGGDNFYNARERFLYTNILFFDDGDRCTRTSSGGAETISKREFTFLVTVMVLAVSLLAFVM